MYESNLVYILNNYGNKPVCGYRFVKNVMLKRHL